MDPATLIVSAVATGAVAALKDTASQAVKDAYAALRSILQHRYGEVDVSPLEAKPASAVKRASLAEDLGETEAPSDRELLGKAQELLDAVELSDPDAAAAVGVDLRQVRAAFVTIDQISTTGSGVVVRDSEFSGGIDIRRIEAGQSPKDLGR